MSEAKHTPGPWFNGTGAHAEFSVFARHGTEGIRLICCTAVNVIQRAQRQNWYDAKLIAAAPELLAAAAEALNALQDYVPSLEKHGASLNYGHSVIRQLQLALAKAEAGSAVEEVRQ